jgi:hypothetical protein
MQNYRLVKEGYIAAYGLCKKKGIESYVSYGADASFPINKKSAFGIGALHQSQNAINLALFVEKKKHKISSSYAINTQNLSAANKGKGAMELSYIYAPR